MELTERERAALVYLDQSMGASAHMVGKQLFDCVRGGGSNLAAIGGAVCGRLRKRGLATQFRLWEWRITPDGRAALAAPKTKTAPGCPDAAGE